MNLNYLYRVPRSVFRRVKKLFNLSKIYPTEIQSVEAGNESIKSMIDSNKPFMIARIGESELEVIRNYLAIDYSRGNNLIKKWWYYILHAEMPVWTGRKTLVVDSGFFPGSDEMLIKFSKSFIEDLKLIDGLGVWYNKGEDYVARAFFSNATLFPLSSIEPYFFVQPWSASLQGKKVLVIHPFSQSIEANYKNRDKLFANQSILPSFELTTIKAVQTIAGTKSQFENWFQALDYMCSEIDKKDFDIAIIGAGAYGLPLAAYVKRKGKQAIHMGGATQILFGIRGVRWDKSASFQQLFNEWWTRPLDSEKPENYKVIGNGNYSYW
jgi:hypothetical protein